MRDTITVTVSASNLNGRKLNEIQKLTGEERKTAEGKVSVIKGKFVLNNATKGRKKVANIKDTLVPTIVKNISKRFEWMEKEEIYDAFKIFDVNEWLKHNFFFVFFNVLH